MENNNYLVESSRVLLDWSFWVVGGVSSQFFLSWMKKFMIDVREVRYCTYVKFFGAMDNVFEK